MPSMQVARSRVTYTDLLNTPEDGRRYEIYGGEVFVVPSPLPRHQMAAQAVFKILDAYAAASGGVALIAPLDIVFDDYDVVLPDVVFFQAARRHFVRPDAVTREAPDIAVEVLSPSTAATDRGRKMQLFARYGVAECWIVDPVIEQVEVHVLEEGVYRRPQVALRENTVHSVVRPDLQFDAARVFTVGQSPQSAE